MPRFARFAILLGIATLLCGCRQASRVPEVQAIPVEEVAAEDARNLTTDGHFYMSGVLTEDGLAALRARGVETVIDLRLADQIPDGYAETVRRLGLRYVNTPLRSDGITSTEAEAALAAVRQARDWPVLLQCGSANRVGAVYGLYQAQACDLTISEALDVAREAGMRHEQMTSDVNELLTGPGSTTDETTAP